MLNLFGTLELLFQIFRLRLSGGPSSAALSRLSKDPVKFPLQNSAQHLGFVNSKHNPVGMQAEFYVENKQRASCEWTRTVDTFQGFNGIIHGGVLVALADELMANCIVAHQKKFGVSLSAQVKWHRPVKVGDTVQGSAQIAANLGPFLLLRFDLKTSNKLAVSGTGTFYLPTLSEIQRMTSNSLPVELHSYTRETN